MNIGKLYVGTDPWRAKYERVKAAIPEGSKYVIQEHELLIMQQLLPTTRRYRFQLYDSQADGQRADEIKLNRNDAFYITHIALRIIRELSTDSATGLTAQNFPKFSYPPPGFFDGAAVGGATEAQSLESLYNSELSFKTNIVERIKDYSTTNFRLVTETQAAANPLVAKDQFGPGEAMRGFKSITPNIGLSGQEDNIAELNVLGNIGNINGDTNAGGTPGQGNLNWVALSLYGFLIIDGSKALTKSQVL